MKRTALALSVVALLIALPVSADEVTVRNAQQLRAALGRARPGTTVLLAPGRYTGGLYLSRVSGAPDKRIVVQGSDPDKPPVFSGGRQAMHFSDCNYLTLRNIVVEKMSMNGLNCDDAGSYETPMHHLVVENVTIRDVGPRGNHDGLKMSGVDQFIIRRCRFEGWGGSGIDMVGCHRGVVEDCTFFGKPGHANSEAIQMKGGCSDNLVQGCLFDRYGDRGLNLGGSTGLQFFRPKVAGYEATRLLVAGNRFYRGEAPVAWPTAKGNRVLQNTIVLPDKWVARILQETRDPQFKPSHDGVFERNVVVYSRRISDEFVNVGRGTAPETFRFIGNAWFCTDGDRRPRLPAREVGGIHQVDPKLADFGKPTMRITSDDPRLKDVGARAWKKLPAEQWIEGKAHPPPVATK
jgi:hypothetical protein